MTTHPWLKEHDRLAPSPRMIALAAEQRGIPWVYRHDLDLLQLGQGARRRWIRSMTTCQESDIAVDLAQDKHMTKKLLASCGIPVPCGFTVQNEEELRQALQKIKGAVVIKPLDGHKGQGVSVGLRTHSEVIHAFQEALSYSKTALLEEQLVGRDIRVLIVNGKFFAAAERIPAHVIGDGHHTISELVERENQNPLRGVGHKMPMSHIRLDTVARAFLERTGRTPDQVPAPGVCVFLRGNANLSQGGCADDVTEAIHPDVRFLCERAARIIGLPFCGIDIILEDVSRPPNAQKCGIIEINAGPGIRVHHFPRNGKPRDAGGAIVDYLYPISTEARIPSFGVFGYPELARGITAELRKSGLRVGTTNPDEIMLDAGINAAVFDSPDILLDSALDLNVIVASQASIPSTQMAKMLSPRGTLIVNAGNQELVAQTRLMTNPPSNLQFWPINPHSNLRNLIQAITALC